MKEIIERLAQKIDQEKLNVLRVCQMIPIFYKALNFTLER